jgi:CheY-like chemotaxis protein
MNDKIKKSVLIVDDELNMSAMLNDWFIDYNSKAGCPYEFEVDIAHSAAECIEKVRAKKSVEDSNPPFDIIVLDVRMEEQTSGLKAALALYEQLGWETPIRIILTGYPTYNDCVNAMRHGVWDYITKESVGGVLVGQRVVNSALGRLQELDLRTEQKQKIAQYWLPEHFYELQTRYGEQLVALWHRPKVEVIASGVDAFELEAKLEDWRKEHAAWEQPYIVQIRPPRGSGKEED